MGRGQEKLSAMLQCYITMFQQQQQKNPTHPNQITNSQPKVKQVRGMGGPCYTVRVDTAEGWHATPYSSMSQSHGGGTGHASYKTTGER